MVRVIVQRDVDDLAEQESKWVMLELQGELEGQSVELASSKLGDLDLDEQVPHRPLPKCVHSTLTFTQTGFATLRIGHHLLSGKRIKLQKPIAVCRLQSCVGSGDYASQCTVMTLVREKYMFKDRPTAILSQDQKGLTVIR
jgi:chromosome transmission fidelity protein 8